MQKTFSIMLLLLFATLVQAQTKIKNVSFRQVGNNIVVNYDLYCNSSFNAQLFYSTNYFDNNEEEFYIDSSEVDDFGNKIYEKVFYNRNERVIWHGPLNSIIGDVHNVKQGQGKSITWNMLKDQNWLISDNIKFKVAEEPNKGTFTDTRDNQTYKWVKIGKQVWMAENLNYKTTKSYCYDNNESNCQKYGRLYTWKVAKNACPDGWHLPSDAEWTELTNYLTNDGYSGTEGTVLKSTSGWYKDGNGTNSYGFLALPVGFRLNNGTFYHLSNYANFWSTTDYDASTAWNRYLYYDYSDVYRDNDYKDYGFSVRCLQD